MTCNLRHLMGRRHPVDTTCTHTARTTCTHTARTTCTHTARTHTKTRTHICIHIYAPSSIPKYSSTHLPWKREIVGNGHAFECNVWDLRHGGAIISRLLKFIGLFCGIPSLLKGCFAKETCNFKEPTNRSHPIHLYLRPDMFH